MMNEHPEILQYIPTILNSNFFTRRLKILEKENYLFPPPPQKVVVLFSLTQNLIFFIKKIEGNKIYSVTLLLFIISL